MEWISVKDRLPDENVPVLVTYKSIFDGSYCSDGIAINNEYGQWIWWDEGIAEEEVSAEITHWALLPEPPGREEV